MKIYIENDNGTRVEVKEIEGISTEAEVLLFKINRTLRYSDMDMLEDRLSKRTGKKCVVLDASIDKVYGV